MIRKLIASGSPYEPVVGFSRAVRVGPHVFVSGTAPTMPGDVDPPSDTYGQARRVLEIMLAALEQAGARTEHVVRTRIYITPAADFREAARAHGEVFKDVRPANAIIVVSGFVDPRWLIEMEAQALIAE
ncbi:MAG: RidA family protein [Actinobacteria bacterium]|nr:RidA family protein [Actinomycetota bacterium]